MGLARCATQGEGTSSLHVSPDLCPDNSSLGLLLLPEVTLGSLKSLSQALVAELSSLCQEKNVDMWWAVCLVGGWISLHFIQPHSPDTAAIIVQLSAVWFPYPPHWGHPRSAGDLLPPSLPPCYHLFSHGEGLRVGSEGPPSVPHLAGGLASDRARRGAHLGNSSRKHPTLLCFRTGVSPAHGK